VIVTADTVLRWQRRRFREYWSKLSGRSTGGRPAVHAEIKTLITRMATANPLWGAPRIHGELLKLGIDVAERTVSRLMPKRRPQPSQTWRTFLANHVRDLVALDFFTVPTARLRVLFVLVVLVVGQDEGRPKCAAGAVQMELDGPVPLASSVRSAAAALAAESSSSRPVTSTMRRSKRCSCSQFPRLMSCRVQPEVPQRLL